MFKVHTELGKVGHRRKEVNRLQIHMSGNATNRGLGAKLDPAESSRIVIHSRFEDFLLSLFHVAEQRYIIV